MADTTFVMSPLFGILKSLTSTVQSHGKYKRIFWDKKVYCAMSMKESYLSIYTDDSITDKPQVSNTSNRPLSMFQSGKKGLHYAGD